MKYTQTKKKTNVIKIQKECEWILKNFVSLLYYILSLHQSLDKAKEQINDLKINKVKKVEEYNVQKNVKENLYNDYLID